ncbi:hypothetical protein M404DRAFT_1006242 [Pisolithus tinctorius Marx 270]|uniref:Uncharacterized protein n=1 Tax=Pisolithus tinctorius Marx 270 TaxID=870435 RepID=A0A0C3NNJ3_PISTI|nr:hypothetical protein M404DRAFT_1006242 [Pisolithus tinctorius Marx 270]
MLAGAAGERRQCQSSNVNAEFGLCGRNEAATVNTDGAVTADSVPCHSEADPKW